MGIMSEIGDIVLRLTNVRRVFDQSTKALEILRGASCLVQAGQLVALVGPSGAGKSTLLHIAGLLEQPTSGSVQIAGVEASKLDDKGRTQLRRNSIGFVYQFHRLLPEFSALENVIAPQMIAGVPRRAASARAQS